MRLEDEKTLIELARCRDQAAISELYQRNVDAIYRYMAHRVSESTVAEDLTAQVFLRALESIENYTDTGLPFSAWLYRIAHARVVDYWRSQRRRPQVELDEGMPADDTGASALEIKADCAALNQAIRLLSDEQQQVVILKFYAGLSNLEIAHILGKTEGAIKALQHRALGALARILEKTV